MPSVDRLTTKVSTKGQVILPKAIRQRRRWEPGTRLVVEDTAEGVLLRVGSLFPATEIEEVFRWLPYSGPAKSLEEMDAGVAAEMKRRHAGD